MSGHARQIPWFLVVGGIGFAVDAGLLQGLLWLGVGPLAARFSSFPVAVIVTYLLHRRFTFAHKRAEKRRKELTKYITAQTISALLGLVAYTGLILYTAWFARYPVAALVVSSAIGTASNYLLSHFVVFRGAGGQ